MPLLIDSIGPRWRGQWWLFVCLWWLGVVAPTNAAARGGVPPAGGLSGPLQPDARVDQARVGLTIFRGGGSRPNGEPIAHNSAWVEGVVTYELEAPALPGQRLVLLNFAETIADDPVELDEIRIATYLDGVFDPGALELTGVWGATSHRRVGTRRDIELILQPGARVVTLRYTVDVPHRYWPFGCVRRRCSLSGAIAPLPSEPAQGGRWMEPGRVVTPVRWTVEHARFAVPGSVRPNVRPGAVHQPPSGSGALWSRPEQVVIIGTDAEPRQYPSVFWGPKWHRLHTIVHGVEIEVLHQWSRPIGHAPAESLIQLRRDVAGQVERIGQEAVALFEAIGHPLPPDQRIQVVQGPLRTTVAQAHPDMVMLSDQALQLLPAPRFMKFHQSAIARAMFDMLAERRFRGAHRPSVDLWLSGMMGLSLTQLWQGARDHSDEFAADILRNFTFVPAVDRFLYTQQASFSQSYFRGVEDRMPLRYHPLWFSHGLPTGRRVHEKLLDTIGADAMDTFYRTLSDDPTRDPTEVAAESYGYTMGWFFDQWLGSYPPVDYHVHRVISEREGGEQWRHEITVEQRATGAVIEPVQVLVEERGGRSHYLIWNGELAEGNESLDTEPARGTHTWVLRTTRPIHAVRLDPRSRLEQEALPPRTNVDPRFNDRRPPSFRFLYTGAGVSIAASEFLNARTPATRFNAIAGFAAFEGSLRRDLRRTGHVQVSRDRETNIGLGTSANFWFGKKRNNQRLRSRVRVSTSGSWLNESSLDPRGGLRFTERVAVVDDTRRFALWPELGHRLSASVAGRHTIRLDGQPEDVHDLVGSASWVQLWRIAHDHGIATSIAAEMVFTLAGRSEFRNLARVGGIGGLSGYLADEIFGLGTLLAQAEYRHVYINDLNLNLLHLGYLRSLGGTLFSGVATVSGCESFDGWLGPDSWYGHAGYALDARVSIFGVTPQLIRADLSVPLVRRDTTCLGQPFPDYLAQRQGLTGDEFRRVLPSFNINVTFQQAF